MVNDKHMLLTLVVTIVVWFATPVDLTATEWYWVQDLGGTWDEEVGDVTSWRGPDDIPGLPASGDDALMVLPYSSSFCNPDGSCFTQPVAVQYASDEDPQLSTLIIESQN